LITLDSDNTPCAKITDFGITRSDMYTSSANFINSNYYNEYYSTQAPEVIEKGEFSYFSDCFSIGVIFWEMLTLEKPIYYDPKDKHELNVDEIKAYVISGGRLPLPNVENIQDSNYQIFVDTIKTLWCDDDDRFIPFLENHQLDEFEEFFHPYEKIKEKKKIIVGKYKKR